MTGFGAADASVIEIKRRIDALLEEIDKADTCERKSLIAHLDRALGALAEQGQPVPQSAQARLDALTEEDIEDQFDNLPL